MVADEVTTSRDEDPMVDVLKDFAPKGGVQIPITKGVTPSGERDGAGGELRGEDAPTTHIPSIDSLLGDIYEL